MRTAELLLPLALLPSLALAQPQGEGDAPRGPDYVTRGPQPLPDPAAWGVGAPVPDLPVTPLQGPPTSLHTLLEDRGALVVFLTSLGCPVTREYAPEWATLARDLDAVGVAVLAVDPNLQDDDDDLRARADLLDWDFPLARDPDHTLIDALRAERTSAVFLIDADGVLRYRGALDDRVGINYRLPQPRRRFLLAAVDAVLHGRDPEVPATDAPGCLLSRVAAEPRGS